MTSLTEILSVHGLLPAEDVSTVPLSERADEAAVRPVTAALTGEPEFLIEPTEPTPLPEILTTSAETSVHVDMLAVAQVRNSLRAKLDRNRKIRFTNFDPLSNGSGIDHDGSSPQVSVQWEDSFIMSEGDDKAGAPRS